MLYVIIPINPSNPLSIHSWLMVNSQMLFKIIYKFFETYSKVFLAYHRCHRW